MKSAGERDVGPVRLKPLLQIRGEVPEEIRGEVPEESRLAEPGAAVQMDERRIGEALAAERTTAKDAGRVACS